MPRAAACAADFSIRGATRDDAAAILDMERLFPSDRMSPRSVRHFLSTPSAKVWALASGRSLAGSLILLTRRNSRVARIYSVVVTPSARGRGFGAARVARAEAWARRHGCHGISLEVRLDNTAARALYAGLGYAEQAQLPGYYDDGAPGVRLRKALA